MASAALVAASGTVLVSAPVTARPPRSAAASVEAASFMPLRHDAAKGGVFLEVPAFDEDVLHYVSAASGGGSVGLPLDRGILHTAVVHFVPDGDRVQVVE